MMSQEANGLFHHHRHHHHFSEFSTIAGNSSVTNSLELSAGHDTYVTMETAPNPGWRGFGHESTTMAAAPAAWPSETTSLKPLHSNEVQALSLSLFKHSQLAPSFQLSHSLQIKSCKYLLPSQELLNEFCSLGEGIKSTKRNNSASNKPIDESSSSWSQQSLYSKEPLELQKRKAKLLFMLDEVDRRYRRYCEQMKAVVSTFEIVAGEGAAKTYSMLASKAMSRHFRCLRDGITGQIKETRRAMGENDSSITPGLTKGETPRLRLLDQSLRQHKAFHQAGMMENHPWRPQRGLPERSVSILRAWLFEHFLHPYPSDVDKHILARQTSLSRSQVSNWFINARVRLWKPMVEEMYIEEIKEEDKSSMQPSHASNMYEGGNTGSSHAISNPNASHSSKPHFDHQDQKPGHIPGHFRINDEPHSLSSIITSMHAHNSSPSPNPNQSFGGILDADFGTYRSGHELTLGLQHHDSPLLFSREPVDLVRDHGDAVQFSMLVGDQGQNIRYRNLMGAQLLHDLAG